MTNFLLRRFVPDYQNTADPAVREKYGNLAGIVGIICNVLLFAGKLLAGTLCGSVSITADAVNNLSDASSSLVTLLGFRLAARPADEKHPYGHARMEYLSGLAVAVMILVIGVELVKSSVQKILHPEAVEFSVLTAAVLGSYIARSDLRHSAGYENIVLFLEPSCPRLPVLHKYIHRQAAAFKKDLFQNPRQFITFGPGKHSILNAKIHASLLRE